MSEQNNGQQSAQQPETLESELSRFGGEFPAIASVIEGAATRPVAADGFPEIDHSVEGQTPFQAELASFAARYPNIAALLADAAKYFRV